MKIPCEGISRKCALKDRNAYYYKEDSQFEDDELNMERSDICLPDFHFLGIAQWSWAEIWNAIDTGVGLILSSIECVGTVE